MMDIPRDATLLIVSDVDGTLLGEGHRLPLPLPEMRRFLATRLGAGPSPRVLALASSRSLSELVLLQRMLGLRGPVLAEDGGVVALHDDLAFDPADGVASESRRIFDRHMSLVRVGDAASALRRELCDAVDVGYPVVLADMAPHALAERGFRSPRAVARAITSREASVLLDLDIAEHDRQRVIDAALEVGITIKRGGRWCTAVRAADKGRALRVLVRAYRADARARARTAPVFVVAIGNEENDVALLAQADLAFVIRNPGRGHHPALLAVPGVVPLQRTGVDGFLEMFDLIRQSTEVRSL